MEMENKTGDVSDYTAAMERQFLDLKVVIDDTTYGYVFSLKKVQDDYVWHCHLCNTRVQCVIFIQDHIDSEKHQQKLAVPRHPRSLFKRIENVNSKQLAIQREKAIGTVAEIQDSLDQFTGAALLGLEYLVEIVPPHRDEEPRYTCLLCDKKGDPRIVLGHLSSFKHQFKYLKEHFPIVYREIQARHVNEKTTKSELQNDVIDVCLQIEAAYGRLKPIVYKRDYFEANEVKLRNLAIIGRHFREPRFGFKWRRRRNNEDNFPAHFRGLPPHNHNSPSSSMGSEMLPVNFPDPVGFGGYGNPDGMPYNHNMYMGPNMGGPPPGMYNPPPPAQPPLPHHPPTPQQLTGFGPPGAPNNFAGPSNIEGNSSVISTKLLLYSDTRTTINQGPSETHPMGPATSNSPIQFPGQSSHGERTFAGGKSRGQIDILDPTAKNFDEMVSEKLKELKKTSENTMKLKDSKMKLDTLSRRRSVSPANHRSRPQYRDRLRSPILNNSQSSSRYKPRTRSRSRDYHRSHYRSRRSRSRTRSRSPRRNRSRRLSRTRSPFGEEIIEDKVELEIINRYKQYEKYPEKHPRYNQEWKRFWERKCAILLADKADPSKYDFKPEWSKFWDRRMKEFYQEDLEMRREELEEKEKKVKSASKENVIDLTIVKEEKDYDGGKDITVEEKNEVKKEATIKEVLEVLSAMESHLGSLGAPINSLLAQVLFLEKSHPFSSESILDNPKTTVLFELVLSKLKGLVASGIGGEAVVTAAKRCIDDISSLLQRAEEKVPPSKLLALPEPSQNTVTRHENVELDKVSIAKNIAQILISQGRTDVSQEELRCLVVKALNESQPSSEPEQKKQPDLPQLASRENKDLSEQDLQQLFNNFGSLSKDVQQTLLAYVKARGCPVKREPESFTPEVAIKQEITSDSEEDTSFKAIFAAVSKKVKEREMAMETEEKIAFLSNYSFLPEKKVSKMNFEQAKDKVMNFMESVPHVPTAHSSSSVIPHEHMRDIQKISLISNMGQFHSAPVSNAPLRPQILVQSRPDQSRPVKLKGKQNPTNTCNILVQMNSNLNQPGHQFKK